MKNDFVFYLTGAEDNMSLALNYLARTRKGTATVIPFKLYYTPPYHSFRGVQRFQVQTRYHPFLSEPRKEAAVILDLSEWIGHEEGEDHLRCFLEYLHDAEGFYEPEYLVTLGKATKEAAWNLFCLVSQYLGTGSVVEDRTLMDRDALTAWLKNAYPLEQEAAEALAEVLLRKPIPSLTWVQAVMEDLLQRAGRKGRITAGQLGQAVPGSKAALLCGASGDDFRQREREDKE